MKEIINIGKINSLNKLGRSPTIPIIKLSMIISNVAPPNFEPSPLA